MGTLHKICGDCIHYVACQSWNVGSLANTDSKTCSFFERASVYVSPEKAKWIEYPECLRYDGAFSDDHIVCSKCHHVWSIIDNCTEEFKYCPNCGADMREEVGDD